MTDIFEEVEESLRQDRYGQAVRKYGPMIAAAAVAIIAGVAAREAWSAMRAGSAGRSSDAFIAAEKALEAGDADAARATLADLGKKGSGAYRTLAKMQEASLAAAGGDKAGAAALYEEAAGLTRDPLLGGLARLKGAYLAADTDSVADLEKRLEPLLSRGSPYEVAARELLGAAALQAGDYDKAREAYTYLTVSLDAPGGVQKRAEEALAVIDAAEAKTRAPSPANDQEG